MACVICFTTHSTAINHSIHTHIYTHISISTTHMYRGLVHNNPHRTLGPNPEVELESESGMCTLVLPLSNLTPLSPTHSLPHPPSPLSTDPHTLPLPFSLSPAHSPPHGEGDRTAPGTLIYLLIQPLKQRQLAHIIAPQVPLCVIE